LFKSDPKGNQTHHTLSIPFSTACEILVRTRKIIGPQYNTWDSLFTNCNLDNIPFSHHLFAVFNMSSSNLKASGELLGKRNRNSLSSGNNSNNNLDFTMEKICLKHSLLARIVIYGISDINDLNSKFSLNTMYRSYVVRIRDHLFGALPKIYPKLPIFEILGQCTNEAAHSENHNNLTNVSRAATKNNMHYSHSDIPSENELVNIILPEIWKNFSSIIYKGINPKLKYREYISIDTLLDIARNLDFSHIRIPEAILEELLSELAYKNNNELRAVLIRIWVNQNLALISDSTQTKNNHSTINRCYNFTGRFSIEECIKILFFYSKCDSPNENIEAYTLHERDSIFYHISQKQLFSTSDFVQIGWCYSAVMLILEQNYSSTTSHQDSESENLDDKDLPHCPQSKCNIISSKMLSISVLQSAHQNMILVMNNIWKNPNISDANRRTAYLATLPWSKNNNLGKESETISNNISSETSTVTDNTFDDLFDDVMSGSNSTTSEFDSTSYVSDSNHDLSFLQSRYYDNNDSRFNNNSDSADKLESGSILGRTRSSAPKATALQLEVFNAMKLLFKRTTIFQEWRTNFCYTLDFYIPELKLIVEIDGPHHFFLNLNNCGNTAIEFDSDSNPNKNYYRTYDNISNIYYCNAKTLYKKICLERIIGCKVLSLSFHDIRKRKHVSMLKQAISRNKN